ncbi:prepilin peptidase [Candidatus Woesearchaeota archaeon]|nr:prepilin peptidase [Candidatus Woesearchaeota archaeon]
MILSYAVGTIVLLAFFLASIEDIRKREVYDYLNFALCFFILIIACLDSLQSKSIVPIKYVGFGLLMGFALGALLYYIGVWGGGDAKFLIGFSASIFYLLPLLKTFGLSSSLSFLFSFLSEQYGDILFLALLYAQVLILSIDVIFLFILAFRTLFKNKRKEEQKDLLFLFLILLSLFWGLLFNLSSLYLFFFGFIAFLFIFFSPDTTFESVYFVVRKPLKEVKESMVLDKKIESVSSGKYLTAGDLSLLKKQFSSSHKLDVRVIFPFSSLVTINYLLYIIKIVAIDKVNLEIFGFLLEFLGASFFIGGVLAFLIISYFACKRRKELHLKVKTSIHILLAFSTACILCLGFFLSSSLYILLTLIFLYYFMKIAKQVESMIFVSPKPIEKIVPGDWIVEDVKVKGHLLYRSEDFKIGVTEEQLENLKALAHEGKITALKVKDGIAFLPPLFLAFLFFLFW